MNFELIRAVVGARPKSFVLVALLLLSNLALLVYLFAWQGPGLEKAKTEWFARRGSLAGGQDRVALHRYTDGVRDLGQFRQRLIPKKDFAAFLARLFATAKKDALQVKGITYKPAPLSDGIFSYGISFSVSGKYAAVKGFLVDLSRNPEMVTIDGLSLSGTSQTEEIVELKVQLTAYLQTEGA